jgi:hypothetical protein
MGKCDLSSNVITNHTLPEGIPDSSYLVLIYAEIQTGYNTGSSSPGVLEVYATVEKQKKAFYVGAHPYPQKAWNVNSDNMWLPTPTSRTIHAQYTGTPAQSNTLCRIYAAGYLLL